MSLRDRGRIKWQGFFVPEHKKLLKDYFEEQKSSWITLAVITALFMNTILDRRK